MAYPIEVRRHILAVREKEKLTYEQTSARFDVGVATLVRWTHSIERKRPEGRPRKIDLDALRQHVCDHPDAYQHERAAHFGVTTNAIFETLRKLGITYKKSTAPPESGRRRTALLLREDRAT